MTPIILFLASGWRRGSRPASPERQRGELPFFLDCCSFLDMNCIAFIFSQKMEKSKFFLDRENLKKKARVRIRFYSLTSLTLRRSHGSVRHNKQLITNSV